MTTLTEIVAAVVVHSSAAAYSHFGVMLEPAPVERPPAERVVARTPAIRQIDRLPSAADRRLHAVKA